MTSDAVRIMTFPLIAKLESGSTSRFVAAIAKPQSTIRCARQHFRDICVGDHVRR